jgi:hypothetical protein
MGEHQGSGAHFVMVEEKRNILVGYVIVPSKIRWQLNRVQTRYIRRVRCILHDGEDASRAQRWRRGWSLALA